MPSFLFCLAREMVLLGLCLGVWSSGANAQTQRIYRCGNVYTNQPDPKVHCKPMTGGLVTVIEGTHVQSPPAGSSSTNANTSAMTSAMTTATPSTQVNANAGPSSVRVDSAEQQQRDVQAQLVLQAELQRAKQQHLELLREWNNGEPERRADEHRQPQKYQDRVAQLRAALLRIDADMAGLQRELSRLSVPAPTGSKP